MRSYIIIILTSLSCFFFKNGNSQDQSVFVDSLLKAGQYDLVISTLKRSFFFNESKDLCSDHLKLAYAYLNKSEQRFFYKEMEMAIRTAENKRKQDSIALFVAHNLILDQRYLSAKQYLYGITATKVEWIEEQSTFHLAISTFGLNEFDESETLFLKMSQTSSDSLTVTHIFAKARKKLSAKRVKLVGTLSYFIPGLGQLYAGDIKSAANSALLVTGLALVYLNTIANYGSVQALVGISPWFLRYYLGGSKNARRSALKRQKTLRNRYLNELIGLTDAH